MHANGFLHKLLSPVMHKKRLDSLNLLVMSLLTHKQLSVTGLGRGIDKQIQEHSCIRRSDRFVGNKFIAAELNPIYKQHIENLLGKQKRPKIIVDWTHVPNTRFYVLRAALVSIGRALTLYEEVHDEKNFGTVKTETKFLTNLGKLLGDDYRPIIITDAGFRNPWFKHVLKHGWDFVGRVRGTHKYYDSTDWYECKSLHLAATEKGFHTGKILLCKTNTVEAYLCAIKEGKHKNKRKKKYRSMTVGAKDIKNYRRSADEPWILATSLPCNNMIQIKRINKIYKTRMQIEEGFRDLKSPKYGFGLRYAYSRSKERVRILFVLAMFASLIAWLTGYVAEGSKLHYQFQSNSIKNRRVVSLFYLGCRIIKRGIRMPANALDLAIKDVRRLAV